MTLNDDASVNVAVKPPIKAADADTDTNCDSDKSHDESECNPDHLSQRNLKSYVSIATLSP